MQARVEVDLRLVGAIFEFFKGREGHLEWLVYRQKIFDHNWSKLIDKYEGFKALLTIIAEEPELWASKDKKWVAANPEYTLAKAWELANPNYTHQQKIASGFDEILRFNTLIRQRSMPQQRAHWICRHIFQSCRYPEKDYMNDMTRSRIPKQAHIDIMIHDHSAFRSWAAQCTNFENEVNATHQQKQKWHATKHELFPHVHGSIVESCFEFDRFFRATLFDSYHIIEYRFSPLKLFECNNPWHAPQTPQDIEKLRDVYHRSFGYVLREHKIKVNFMPKSSYSIEDVFQLCWHRKFKKMGMQQKLVVFCECVVPRLKEKNMIVDDVVSKIRSFC